MRSSWASTPRASRRQGASCARSCSLGLSGIVPLAGLLAWLLAGNALRTVSELTEEAEAVGLSDIGRGLDVAAGDPELARLVAALDRMLARVAASLERERRFAADASHRLRTPFATLRAEAELALLEGDPRSMREALQRVIDDADDLGELVARLLAAHTATRVPRPSRSATRCRPPANGGSARSWPAGRG